MGSVSLYILYTYIYTRICIYINYMYICNLSCPVLFIGHVAGVTRHGRPCLLVSSQQAFKAGNGTQLAQQGMGTWGHVDGPPGSWVTCWVDMVIW